MSINITLKSAIYRVMTDLVKADNIINLEELEFLDQLYSEYGITEGDILNGYQISLGDALSFLATQPETLKSSILSKMTASAGSDGDKCSRTESVLFEAVRCIFKEKGCQMISIPTRSIPVDMSYILYIEDKGKGLVNSVLSKEEQFNDINNIAMMGGFEIIYIPRIARHYHDCRNVNDLKRVITLVSPPHTDKELDDKIRSLQHMTTQYFYQNILKGKMGIPVTITNPSWLLRTAGSVVNGTDYTNFLVMEVKKDAKAQIQELVNNINSRMHEYPIVVNTRHDSEADFMYGGFYKAILDVMSIKKVDRWSVCFRTYGDGTDQFKDTESGKKTTVTVIRDDEEYPVYVSGRDAAFYLMLILASATGEGSVDFEDRRQEGINQRRYEFLYQRLSRRSVDGDTDHKKCPDVTAPRTRIPMKSRLISAIKDSNLTEKSLYMPQEKGRNNLYVPVDPSRVIIESPRGRKALTDIGCILLSDYKGIV